MLETPWWVRCDRVSERREKRAWRVFTDRVWCLLRAADASLCSNKQQWLRRAFFLLASRARNMCNAITPSKILASTSSRRTAGPFGILGVTGDRSVPTHYLLPAPFCKKKSWWKCCECRREPESFKTDRPLAVVPDAGCACMYRGPPASQKLRE